MKTGRNEPCPCGSGKKYKKCCINAVSAPMIDPRFVDMDLELDNLSNQVPALIRQNKYVEAEGVCRRLLDEYPDQIDGLHRLAELLEAKGEYQQAAEYYLKSAEFARQNDGFEQASIDNFMEKVEELGRVKD
jgi:tetratricopeptide (TPR) repeat protein